MACYEICHSVIEIEILVYIVAMREREKERSLLAILNIHSCITNKINVTCGRLPEKAKDQQAGHLVKKI